MCNHGYLDGNDSVRSSMQCFAAGILGLNGRQVVVLLTDQRRSCGHRLDLSDNMDSANTRRCVHGGDGVNRTHQWRSEWLPLFGCRRGADSVAGQYHWVSEFAPPSSQKFLSVSPVQIVATSPLSSIASADRPPHGNSTYQGGSPPLDGRPTSQSRPT